MTLKSIKTYSEMLRYHSFEDRYRYLRLDGLVGEQTFGFDRYLNQIFYRTKEWKALRDTIIERDNGCDLGIKGRKIYERILIHHLNPITMADIEQRSSVLFDPENLICTTHSTHNAIHYGDENLLVLSPPERTKYDTCPWKHL